MAEKEKIDNVDWKFHVKFNECLTPSGFGIFTSKVRLPASGSVLLTKEVRAIIDTSEFQRLKGVRQLGPTYFVFPGANHTRFEHSLGVYSLTLKYLERVLSLNPKSFPRESLDKSIKLIVLASLLHDIGHYPYSHWIEELKIVDGHEKRARTILNNREINGTTANDNEGKPKTIYDVIEQVWKVSPDEVAAVISDSGHDTLLNSFINSPIDADKIDYLVRDSIHCGINYGMGIDIERIIESLTIDDEVKKICVTDKGRSAIQSVLSARNIMYQEVYWHKTVRACEAMFKRFFFEYFSENSTDLKKEKEVQDLLKKSDDEFISFLNIWANDKPRLKEIIEPFAYKGRRLYKAVYVYYDRSKGETKFTRKFFRSLFNGSYVDILVKSNKLVDILQKHETLAELHSLDILLEITPIKDGGEYPLDDFKIYNNRKSCYDSIPAGLSDLNEYLSKNRQAYIFCNPDFHTEIAKLINDKNGFGEMLKQILT